MGCNLSIGGGCIPSTSKPKGPLLEEVVASFNSVDENFSCPLRDLNLQTAATDATALRIAEFLDAMGRERGGLDECTDLRRQLVQDPDLITGRGTVDSGSIAAFEVKLARQRDEAEARIAEMRRELLGDSDLTASICEARESLIDAFADENVRHTVPTNVKYFVRAA